MSHASCRIAAIAAELVVDAARGSSALSPGVDLVGFAFAEFGLAESLRGLAAACVEDGIPFAVKDVDMRIRTRQVDETVSRYVARELSHRCDRRGARRRRGARLERTLARGGPGRLCFRRVRTRREPAWARSRVRRGRHSVCGERRRYAYPHAPGRRDRVTLCRTRAVASLRSPRSSSSTRRAARAHSRPGWTWSALLSPSSDSPRACVGSQPRASRTAFRLR